MLLADAPFRRRSFSRHDPQPAHHTLARQRKGSVDTAESDLNAFIDRREFCTFPCPSALRSRPRLAAQNAAAASSNVRFNPFFSLPMA
eukprot:3021326-Pleurochrysis_carterae.AAC.1